MYYFLLVTYDISSLTLEEESHLYGPYDTPEIRTEAIKEEAKFLDSEYVVSNITLMKIDSKTPKSLLEYENSFILDPSALEDQDEDIDEDATELFEPDPEEG